MTVQWMLIASFLYFELALIALLILPFISPKIWCSFFHFHLWKTVQKKANIYFNVLIFVLILFFVDSIRDMRKYSTRPHNAEFDSELQTNVKLFRSQRNYYISGFAVFLWLVIRQLVVLILDEADLLVKNEEAAKKAQSATENLEKLLKLTKEVESSNKADLCSKSINKVKKLEEELDTKKSELLIVKQKALSYEEKARRVQEDSLCLLKKSKELKGDD